MEDESSSQAGNKRIRTKNETLKQEGSPIFILLFFFIRKRGPNKSLEVERHINACRTFLSHNR
jgi:hypothetical protein